MPLLTLKAVAEELGLQSEQSVRNLADRGELTIVRVKITGTRGSPRIDAAELEQYKRRLVSNAGGDEEDQANIVPRNRSALKRPKAPSKEKMPPGLRQARGRRLVHFE